MAAATLESLAIALGGDPGELRSLGGASGAAWGLGDAVMRVGSREGIDRELSASGAAAAVVPVPGVLDRVDEGDVSAVLLELMPGTLGWSENLAEERAERRGLACGRLHRVIAEVAAPPNLPVAEGGEGRLMHFDLHPLNVLFDENDDVSAVLDWANAGSGSAPLDRARTAAILFLDPTAIRLGREPSVRAFIDGWRRSAGADEILPADYAGAAEYLIRDLSHRHTPEELAPARAAAQGLRGDGGR